MTPEIEKRIKLVQAGKVPAGYKRTKIGIVPKEWHEVRFHDMFSRLLRKNKEGNTNVLTISAQYGLINQEEFFNKTVASDDKSNYFLLEKGEFAYNKSYSSGYPFGALKRLDLYEKGVVSPLYICFSANAANECPDFYVHYFEAGLMNKEIQAFAQEGARNHGLLNIAVDDFFNSNLLYPPKREQEKIAEILAAQDRVIELKEKLVAEKQRKEVFLIHQLLSTESINKISRKIVIDDICIDKRKWSKTKFGSFSTPFSKKNKNNLDLVPYAITNENGFVPQNEAHNEFGYMKNVDRRAYNIVSSKSFAYNPARINVGSIGYYDGDNDVIVSSLYEVFKVSDNVDDKFLWFWLKSDLFTRWIEKLQEGSVRQYFYYDKLCECEISLPSLPEQQAIAKVLSAADEEIALLQKNLEQEKLKKKSLMQLLLTGLVRVSA